MNLNKALFGGALMAAGMTANAQTFIYNATDTTGTYQSFAYSDAYGGTVDISYASGALNTSSTGTSILGTTTVSTSQTANSMRVDGQWDGTGPYGYGYGGSFIQQFFQVSANADLVIEWDFSGTDNYAFALVLEDPSFGLVFELDGLGGDPSSGSTTISLTAGTDYAVNFGLVDGFLPFFFSTENQFISMTLVPAPGAIAVLGLGGLVATRRRR